ncbi:unnamed protein product [Leptosia nina]|uniref:FLYWCH-type domain-containing protein n=1 Tax=Leptosia nina TaxID=320188 RepID=A0AAV1J602_9NEOP
MIGFIVGKSKKGTPVIEIGKYRFRKASGCRPPMTRPNLQNDEAWASTDRMGWLSLSYVERQSGKVESTMDLWKVAAFSLSRFGKPVIEYGGERFYKNSGSRGVKLLWRCVKARSRACRATLHTVSNRICRVSNEHSH